MNIYLIGFMGVGKTTIGHKLAKTISYEFVDTDELIEQDNSCSISEIFKLKGEEYFRELEHNMLKSIAGKDKLVVSCGGGIIKNDDNIRLMKESGRVVLLEADAKVIYNRVKNCHNRPLLEGHKNIDDINHLMSERQPLYDKACTDRVRVDKAVNEVVKEITDILSEVKSL